MITLATLKDELGIETNSTKDDAALKRCLRQTFAHVRRMSNRYLHCATDSYAVADTLATVRAIGHGVAVGDSVRLVNTGTNLDGVQDVTAITRDTISFTVAGALSGTAQEGSLHPRRTVTFAGNGSLEQWIPQHATPWHSLISVEFLEDDVWTAQTLANFTAAGDEQGRSLLLTSAEVSFPIWTSGIYPSMVRTVQNASHNVRLTYDAGAVFLPDEIEQVCLSMACELFELQGTAKDVSSITVSGTSRGVLSGTEKYENRYSPDAVLLSWRA